MEKRTQELRLVLDGLAPSLEKAEADFQAAVKKTDELREETEKARRAAVASGDGWDLGRYQKLSWTLERNRAGCRLLYWQVEEKRGRWGRLGEGGWLKRAWIWALRLDEEAELQQAAMLALKTTDELSDEAERRRVDLEEAERAGQGRLNQALLYERACGQRDRAWQIERALYRQVERFLRRRRRLAGVRAAGRWVWKVLEAVGKVRKVLRGAGLG